jgi:hypothetical protein
VSEIEDSITMPGRSLRAHELNGIEELIFKINVRGGRESSEDEDDDDEHKDGQGRQAGRGPSSIRNARVTLDAETWHSHTPAERLHCHRSPDPVQRCVYASPDSDEIQNPGMRRKAMLCWRVMVGSTLVSAGS